MKNNPKRIIDIERIDAATSHRQLLQTVRGQVPV
jgi:hypothetical protein